MNTITLLKTQIIKHENIFFSRKSNCHDIYYFKYKVDYISLTLPFKKAIYI